MALLHLRVVCPAPLADRAVAALTGRAGIVAVTRATSSDGDVVSADLARECADDALGILRDLGVYDDGLVMLSTPDTTVGALADRAEDEAPGDGADAVIWDELAARTGEDATLTATFLAFLVLATILAGIGVVTDSSVTIVGAMVVGPEFGPLAALCVALLRRRRDIARRAAAALLVGFPVAIAVTAVLTLLGRASGLVTRTALVGHSQTQFIYQPGWFSLITAVVAGTAGMLSLTSSKSAALVGVFISVTTVPAAGNAAVAAVLGQWGQSGKSLLQLAINIAGILVAGVLTLMVLQAAGRLRGAGQRRAGQRRAAATSAAQ